MVSVNYIITCCELVGVNLLRGGAAADGYRGGKGVLTEELAVSHNTSRKVGKINPSSSASPEYQRYRRV